MKILQINKFYYNRGGSERYMFDLSEHLERQGHKVIPFSTKDGKNRFSEYEKYFADHVDVNRVRIKDAVKTFYNHDAVKKLDKLIRAEKPDIAHLHNIHNHLSPAIVSVLKKHGMPLVMTLHDYKPFCPNRQLYANGRVCEDCRGKKYYHCFLKKCVQSSRAKSLIGAVEGYMNDYIYKFIDQVDLFIAPSRFMKDMAVKFGLDGSKIKVINNFIDADGFTPDKSKLAECDYYLYFGRISEEKGIATLLDAFRQLGSGYKLKLAGSGPDREKFQRIAKEKNPAGQIEFVGQKSAHDLKKLLQDARAVVMPSLWHENFPYSLLEALAAGKIVIASCSGGMPEVLKNGINGFLFQPGNSSDLAGKIADLENRADSRMIKARARATAERFAQGPHVEKIIKIYETLSAKKYESSL